MKIVFTAILIILLSIEPAIAQSSFFSQPESDGEIFVSYQLLGNGGIEDYGLTHQSGINRDSVVTEFITEFGTPDERPNMNTFVWEHILNLDLYNKPFKLKLSATNVMQADGETPSGMTWINIFIETESDKLLLKPDTESYNTFISFFDNLVAKHVNENE